MYVSTKTRPIGPMVSQGVPGTCTPLRITLPVRLCDTVCGHGRLCAYMIFPFVCTYFPWWYVNWLSKTMGKNTLSFRMTGAEPPPRLKWQGSKRLAVLLLYQLPSSVNILQRMSEMKGKGSMWKKYYKIFWFKPIQFHDTALLFPDPIVSLRSAHDFWRHATVIKFIQNN